MSCAETIQSNETYDFIVASDEGITPVISPVCIQPINEKYAVWYYDRTILPPLSVERYSYTAIPKCFSLMDSTSLEVSGILSLQNQPTLSLNGQGIFIGIIDTGIAYTLDAFRNEAGQTRIFSIWDQTAEPEGRSVSESENSSLPVAQEDAASVPENGFVPTQNENLVQEQNDSSTLRRTQSPEGFLYGVEYTKEQIQAALDSENPLSIVPETDENGHGTFLASVAAGSADAENDFIGAAPQSELVIVKLKPAKQNLREFFYLSETEELYQENDIMAGAAYLESVARRENRPLVILIGAGSNQGSHVGTDPLSQMLSEIGEERKRAVVVAAGNQAAARHHYFGRARSVLSPEMVEMNVEAGIAGFCMELWSFAPEQVWVVVQSPTGQQSQGRFPIQQETQNTNFVFENTTLTVDYRVVGRERGDLLIFFRFSRPSEGIWTIRVYPEQSISGEFHIWLPITSRLANNITFIQPNPDTTITTPATAEVPITVGAYNGLNGARYLESGRGFDPLGQTKPDFCAPGVEVFGSGTRGNYITTTGTSAAAAITAGAAALCLEWGILRGNAPVMNSVQVKNLLIRGCRREENREYPNTEWGYGKLDVYHAFEVLR